ncbi:MAG: hypothetical protein OK456_07535 [Thaumarchaeota archaeon]|nr:hypothetical protein [Nitrososphaerota archaeon]
MPQAGSLGSNLARLSLIAWLERNRVYLFLLALDLVFFSAWSVLTGIAPAGDIRAHIFRTLEFAQGISGGDYTSIQYHGYAFLAGYGIGFYAFTWSIYLLLVPFVASYRAATIACNVMWVLTPLVLALSAVALADELGMKGSSHRRLMQTLLGGTVLLLLAGTTDLTGADPYMLSFSFSLLALVYGLRTRGENRGALLGLLAFSALSIYTESYGYFFVGAVFLGLVATGKPVLKVLPVLAAVCAFSWVQLLEVSGYTSAYIEELPVLGISFPALVGGVVLVVCAYSIFAFGLREKVDERYQAVYVVLAVTTVATSAAVLRASFGWNFGILNSVVDSILPWRFLFVNLPILLLVSICALVGLRVHSKHLGRVLVVLSIVLISGTVVFGMYPVTFGAVPPAAHYHQYSGDRLLVAGPALTIPASVVNYSPAFGYSTVSGPFSEGDPSFFSLTAYYEWSDHLIANPVVAQNLMHLTGANELLTNPDGVPETFANSSSSIVPYSQAEAVTPILLEAANSTEAQQFALFVNLLGINGFTLDFVTSAPAGEAYGAVVLPGYHGTTPADVPVYSVDNASQTSADLSAPIIEPFVTPPFDLFGPVSNASVAAASSVATALISFFHPTYTPVQLTQGADYYSVSSNSSLPIQLSVSYYPYFTPDNYTENVYHFILLPGTETITWHLPLYELAAATSLLATLGIMVFWLTSKRRSTQDHGNPAP